MESHPNWNSGTARWYVWRGTWRSQRLYTNLSISACFLRKCRREAKFRPELYTVMKPPRRTFLHLAAGAAALSALSRMAVAQAYPTRPVRILVAFPAAAPTHIVPRLIGQRLSA